MAHYMGYGEESFHIPSANFLPIEMEAPECFSMEASQRSSVI